MQATISYKWTAGVTVSGLANIKLIEVVFICVAFTKEWVYNCIFCSWFCYFKHDRKIIEMTEILVDRSSDRSQISKKITQRGAGCVVSKCSLTL